MNRKYGVDVLKLTFAVSIALGHFGIQVLTSAHVVNCFFVLSGYFLLSSFDSGKYSGGGVVEYTCARLKRIYPLYLTSFVLLFFITNFSFTTSPLAYVSRLFNRLPELLLLQNVGIYDGGINYPCWQMCTLLVASHMLFALLDWNRNVTVNVISPLVAFAAFTYQANVYQSHQIEIWGVLHSVIYVPMLRAFGGLCFGVFVKQFIDKATAYLENRCSKVVVSLLSILAILLYLKNSSKYDSLLAFSVLLPFLLINKGIVPYCFNRKQFAFCEVFSLAIYFNHAAAISVANRLLNKLGVTSRLLSTLVFLGVLVVISVIALQIPRWGAYFMEARKKKIQYNSDSNCR